jgi:hypothetical protein
MAADQHEVPWDGAQAPDPALTEDETGPTLELGPIIKPIDNAHYFSHLSFAIGLLIHLPAHSRKKSKSLRLVEPSMFM